MAEMSLTQILTATRGTRRGRRGARDLHGRLHRHRTLRPGELYARRRRRTLRRSRLRRPGPRRRRLRPPRLPGAEPARPPDRRGGHPACARRDRRRAPRRASARRHRHYRQRRQDYHQGYGRRDSLPRMADGEDSGELQQRDRPPAHAARPRRLAPGGGRRIGHAGQRRRSPTSRSSAQPHIGLITNVGVSHLELLGSRDAIAEAKAELLEVLPPEGRAVLNRDDEYFEFLAARSEAPVLSYGLHEGAAVRVTEFTLDAEMRANFRLVGEAHRRGR